MAWRIFLVGVFLTPFALVRPVGGIGFSVGDVFLVVGSLTLLATTPARRGADWWFALPGFLLISAAAVSALLNGATTTRDVATVVAQYAMVLMLVPIALARQPRERVVHAIVALLWGFAVSVLVGLLLLWRGLGYYTALLEEGWLVSAAGREGLFTGVGELSKLAALCIPLIYFVAVSGWQSPARSALLLGTVLAALILSRSAAGVIAAVVAAVVVAVGHLALRRPIRAEHPPHARGRVLLALGLGVLGGLYAVRRLDESGADYLAEFEARVSVPWGAQGLGSVGSAEVRELLVRESWDVIGQHPLIGVGPDQYAQVSQYRTSVHVVPLNLWAEVGLVGLLAWVLLFSVCLLGVLASARRDPLAAVATTGVLAAFLVACLSLPYMYGRVIALPVVLGCLLAAAATRSGSGSTATLPAGSHRRPRPCSAPTAS